MGINSAPTFILNGQHVITGAQNVEFWSNLITEIKESMGVYTIDILKKKGVIPPF